MSKHKVALAMVFFVLHCNEFTRAQTDEDGVLANDLNYTDYDNRVFACEYPYTAQNDTCTCLPGFYMQGVDCVECAAGTFKNDIGDHTCSNCPQFTTSFSGAISEDECLCSPGYSLINSECQACPVATYKEAIGNWACQPCIGNSTTLQTASSLITQCQCIAGFYGSHNTTCTACPIGTFKENVANLPTACVSCPQFSTTLNIASTLRTNCLCNLGYTGSVLAVYPGAQECTACPVATYKDVLGSIACTDCTEFSTSPLHSTSQSQCKCVDGYQPNANTCQECEENFYCPGDSLKVKCMSNSTGPVNSDSLDNCVCNAGHYKSLDNEHCLICLANFFCVGDNLMQECPENSTSVVGAYNINQCKCSGGFQRIND